MNAPEPADQQEDQRAGLARTRLVVEVRERVQRAAVTVFGAGEVWEPIFEGYRITGPTLDDPLAGVRAARLVADIAVEAMRDWALRARGAGHDWADLAHALDLPTLDGPPDGAPDGAQDAEAAFEWLIEHRTPTPASDPVSAALQGAGLAGWRCRSCREWITDRGPFESHPEEREQGHGAGCARQRAALEAWRRDNDQADEHDQDDEQDDEQDRDDEHEHDEREWNEGGGGRR